MEKWDLYDQYRHKIEKQITRGETLAPDEFRLVVHVCIFNSKGEMLIQQRQPFKQGWSNLWDLTCGGSAVMGFERGNHKSHTTREVYPVL
ncbi:NUDIX hydrolase [Fictibacillus macauensis ZFHKF-1]|uniref:NUDIX hydrolase n=1 Tax=Fictibacillus macauensis ZFHKF-1 TaxID=1196324 RepID=I8UJL2_9BACL|nr:NUDIX hydrolase [Fictibacillus macauensis ZFHKF-1]